MPNRVPLAYSVLVLALVGGVVISLGVGAVPLSPTQVLAALLGHPERPAQAAIVWDFRLGRVLLVCVCGAALAAAGTGFQGLFRNPLADPYVVGASSGAAFGATLSLYLTPHVPGGVSLGLAGCLGAMAAVLVVFALAESSGFGSLAGLLMTGAALSTMLSAVVSLVLVLDERAWQEVFAWLLGGFAGRSWPQLLPAAGLAAVGVAILWLMARPLDSLATGEDGARALGLDLRWTRLLIILGAGLATAAAVSAGGLIGFVGLVAPHLARLVFGASHARLMPAAMLAGALLLLVADGFARTLLAPLELPVGVLTALVGGPFFLLVLRARGRVA